MKTWTDSAGAAALPPRHRDAVRLALQSAVASAAAYLAISFLGTGEAFLAVISAVLVLQTNRGQTVEQAGSRLLGAAIGTVVGIAALLITPSWAVSLSLAAVMLIMGAIAAYKPAWRYGVVAAAGLAVGSEKGLWQTAQDRGVAIFVGALLGIAVGALLWPESTRKRARRQMGEAMEACRELLTEALNAAVEGSEEEVDKLHSRFSRALSAARDTAAAIRPKGGSNAVHYGEAVHHVERLWHALVILDRVAEARSGAALPLRPATLDLLKRMRLAACDALACLERFERAPPDELETLEDACRKIWNEAEICPEQTDELQSVGLVFGMNEVARNLREIDQAVCAIGAGR